MLSTLVLIVLAVNSAFAQASVIKGKVTDASGIGLPGVSILVEGTTQGTVTDVDGNYSITVSSDQDILVFSFLGFISEKRAVGNNSQINVELAEDLQELSEVVVVGYGETNRRDLTGSVGSAPLSEMSKAPAGSVDQALQGRIAGVQVTTSSGRPGTAADIRIRGASSITGSSAPLWVVDGFILPDFDPTTIDPSDIENMEVLKGPSAIAIYGTRGSNGVIMVTTRTGKKEQVNVNYNGFVGVQGVTKTLDVLTPYQFVDLRYEVDGETNAMRAFGPLEGYEAVEGVNWQEEVFRNTPVESHTFTVNGGNESTRYALAATSYNTEGLIEGSLFNRKYLKLKIDQDLSDKLVVGTNISYSKSQTDGIFTSANILNNDGSGSSNRFGYLKDVVQSRPTGGLALTTEELLTQQPNQDQAGTAFVLNPLVTARTMDRFREDNQLIWNGYVDYKIIKGLKMRVNGGLSRNVRESRAFNHINSPRYIRDGFTSGSVENRVREYYNVASYLTYKRNFGTEHEMTAMLGTEYNESVGTNVEVLALEFPDVNSGLDNLSASPSVTADSYRLRTNKLISQFTRVNYIFRDKYLFTGTLRRDGSSKFGSLNKFGIFPSVSGAWRFGDEDFVQNLGIFADGKLRVEWGQVGNDRIASGLSGSLLGSSGYGLNNSIAAGVTALNKANPEVRWEKQEQVNIGLDLGFVNNRITTGFDIYRKDSKDLLLISLLPPSSGFSDITENVGKIRNEGVELSLNAIIMDKEFKWTSNLNISKYRTETLKLTGDQDSLLHSSGWDARPDESAYAGDYITILGQPFGQMYGYVADGLFLPQDFDTEGNPILDITAVAGEAAQTGYRKYVDMNGDSVINSEDKVVLGNTVPKFFGGITNNFSYKGVDLSVFLTFSVGNKVYNANRILYTSNLERNRNVLAEVNNRWRTDLTVDENVANNPTFRSADDKSAVLTNEYIEDGSFLRLQVVSLGYTFPKAITSKVNLNKVRVYVTGQNLVTWTKYSGFDPEGNSRGNGLTSGVDYGAYPRSRALIGGVSVSF